MMFLRKIIICLLVLLGPVAFGQYKNSFKFNLTGAPFNLYSIQYERKLNSNISFNNTFFYRLKSGIPFGEFIDKVAKERGVGLTGIKFEYIFMNEAHVGVKGYSPELRFYFGKSKHRPFVGVFGMIEDFDMQVPAELLVKNMEVKVPIDFTFTTLSGGILIGKQFQWDRIGLDIVIIGPHLGVANDFMAFGRNSAIQNLSDHDKNEVKEQVKQRFGLRDKYFTMDITDESAEIKSIRSVPYFGIRGVGLNLSYSF
jgi:hypothetical protein